METGLSTQTNPVTHSVNTFPVFDLAVALEKKLVNRMSYQQIGDYYGIKKNTVYKRLRKFLSILDISTDIGKLDGQLTNLFTAGTFKYFQELLNEDKLKDASLNNIAYAFTQINNARLTQQGKAPLDNSGLMFIVVNAPVTQCKHAQSEEDVAQCKGKTIEAEVIDIKE